VNPRFLQAIPVIASLFALNLPAQNTDAPPDVQAFAAQYVAAFNAKDQARVESLYLPESRACITPANDDVYDAMLTMQMRDSVPSNYIVSFMAVNEGNLKAISSQATFPVRPECELHIDYQYPETNDGGQIDLWLVRRDGRWMADFPCMSAQAIQGYRDNAKAREHYKTLAAAIKEPLRSQLLAMLRAHQSGEAATRYQQVNGGDMRTAMLVINALADEVH
jgi:hypothetical protein